MKPSFGSLCTGMVIAFAFYQLGAVLHKFLPMIPTYAWMILAVVLVKGTGILSETPGGRGQRVGAVCHPQLDGGSPYGDRIHADRPEFDPEDADGSLSACGGGSGGCDHADGGGPGKAGGILSSGIRHCGWYVYHQHGRLWKCGRFKQRPPQDAPSLCPDCTRSCGALMLTLGGILVQLVG